MVGVTSYMVAFFGGGLFLEEKKRGATEYK